MIIEVKVCENCGHRNAVTAVECEECGYDLTFAFPQKIDDSSTDTKEDNNGSVEESDCTKDDSSVWELFSISNENTALMITGELALGRDCEAFSEQFNSSNYTSRMHAKIRINDDKVQIMDASTNGTFVNEKRISKMDWITVEDGSTIRFADVSFKIRRR